MKLFSKKPFSKYVILYLSRAQLQVHTAGMKQVVTLLFSPAMVQDLAIINTQELRRYITKLIVQSKIKESPVLMVISNDSSFQKIIDPASKVSPDVVLDEIRGSMPFTNVYARLVRSGKQSLVLALNREWYEPFLEIFKDLKFDVTTVVPECSLGAALTNGLTPELALALADDAGRLEAFDLLETQETTSPFMTTTVKTDKERRRLLLLAGVFSSLLLILAAVWYFVNYLPNQPSAARIQSGASVPLPPAVAPAAVPVISVSPLPELAPAATDAATSPLATGSAMTTESAQPNPTTPALLGDSDAR